MNDLDHPIHDPPALNRAAVIIELAAYAWGVFILAGLGLWGIVTGLSVLFGGNGL